jgi:hypothetical protein
MTFPFGPGGLITPAYVGLTSTDLAAALVSGASPPLVMQVRAMIDTGTTVTAVASRVLSSLNVPAGPLVETTTAAGLVRVPIYHVSFTIYDLASGNTYNRHHWTVTGLAHDLDDVDVLFGLDLLREIVLLVDGPRQTFSLDF